MNKQTAVVPPVVRRVAKRVNPITHEFAVDGHEGLITVYLFDFEDGRPGEVLVTMNRTGSAVIGCAQLFASGITLALQYGAPIEDVVNQFYHDGFEPAGRTNDESIPYVKSIASYVLRWLASKFVDTPR